MASLHASGQDLAGTVIDTAGAVRAVAEPVGLVPTDEQEETYEMGRYLGAAAGIRVLQGRGLLSRSVG